MLEMDAFFVQVAHHLVDGGAIDDLPDALTRRRFTDLLHESSWSAGSRMFGSTAPSPASCRVLLQLRHVQPDNFS